MTSTNDRLRQQSERLRERVATTTLGTLLEFQERLLEAHRLETKLETSLVGVSPELRAFAHIFLSVVTGIPTRGMCASVFQQLDQQDRKKAEAEP